MKIEHWRYEDGWHPVISLLRKDPKLEFEFDPSYQGWFCWVYPDSDEAFEKWAKDNFQHTYSLDHRFNGGNPMYTLVIHNKNDAATFVRYAQDHKIYLKY